MINRKGKIRKIAIASAVLAFAVLSLAFIYGGRSNSSGSETVETFYGKAVFGGRFSWLDNIKRPGLSASFRNAKALDLGLDLSLKNAQLPSLSVNPGDSMELIASITDPSFGGPGYAGPFDREPGLGDVVDIQQLHAGPIPLNFGGSRLSGGSSGGGGGEDIPDLPTVPVPASLYLVLTGLFATFFYSRKVSALA